MEKRANKSSERLSDFLTESQSDELVSDFFEQFTISVSQEVDKHAKRIFDNNVPKIIMVKRTPIEDRINSHLGG